VGKLRTWVLIITPMLWIGCSSHSEDRLLAQVGNAKLWESDLRELLPRERRAIPVADLQASVKRWAEHQLLVQEALRRDLGDDPSVKDGVNRIREELMIAKLRETVQPEFEPTETQLKAYYTKTSSLWYTQTTEVRGWIWQSEDEKELTALWRQTRTDMAPSTGLEFDWMPVQRLGPLADELQRLAPGYFTQPVRWGKRWMFAQLADIRPAGILKPFAEIRSEVRVRYLIDLRESKMDSLTSALRRKMVDKGKYTINDVTDIVTDTKSTSKKDKILSPPRSLPVPVLDDTTRNDIEDLFRDMEKSEKKH
jgi:hypothetical protein